MPESFDPESFDPELLKRLEKAVSTLPRTTCEIFLAHRLDGMSYLEIADRTGLSVRQIERHMARAIDRLCRHLDLEPLRWWERVLAAVIPRRRTKGRPPHSRGRRGEGPVFGRSERCGGPHRLFFGDRP